MYVVEFGHNRPFSHDFLLALCSVAELNHHRPFSFDFILVLCCADFTDFSSTYFYWLYISCSSKQIICYRFLLALYSVAEFRHNRPFFHIFLLVLCSAAEFSHHGPFSHDQIGSRFCIRSNFSRSSVTSVCHFRADFAEWGTSSCRNKTDVVLSRRHHNRHQMSRIRIPGPFKQHAILVNFQIRLTAHAFATV